MQSNKYNSSELVNKEFSMHVRDRFTSIDAHVLPPPPIKYHGTAEVNPQVGQWNMIDLVKSMTLFTFFHYMYNQESGQSVGLHLPNLAMKLHVLTVSAYKLSAQ